MTDFLLHYVKVSARVLRSANSWRLVLVVLQLFSRVCVFVYSSTVREGRKVRERSLERKLRDMTEKQKHIRAPTSVKYSSLALHLSLFSPASISLWFYAVVRWKG